MPTWSNSFKPLMLNLKVSFGLVAWVVTAAFCWPGVLAWSSSVAVPPRLPQPHESVTIDWSQVPSLDELELASFAAIAVELPSGRIEGALEADVELPLASLTKLMTAVVALEQKVPSSTAVTFVPEDSNGIIAKFLNLGDSVSRLKVGAGEAVRFQDLLGASLIASANNAATALARTSGLDRAQFVARMNERAAILGMPTAIFTEVTGLDAENTASAYDVAVLARYAWRNATLRTLSGSPSYKFTTAGGVQHTLKHTNALARASQPFAVLASKTGFLDEAGDNIALAVRDRKQRQHLIVLLNAPTLAERTADIRTMVRWLESQP